MKLHNHDCTGLKAHSQTMAKTSIGLSASFNFATVSANQKAASTIYSIHSEDALILGVSMSGLIPPQAFLRIFKYKNLY